MNRESRRQKLHTGQPSNPRPGVMAGFVLLGGVSIVMFFGSNTDRSYGSEIYMTYTLIQFVGVVSIWLAVRRSVQPKVLIAALLIAIGLTLLMMGLCTSAWFERVF